MAQPESIQSLSRTTMTLDPQGERTSTTYKYWILAAIALLALPQIYTIRVFGSYIPLAILPILLSAPLIKLLRKDRRIIFLLAAYYVVTLYSVAWSPNHGAWANYCLFFLAFPLPFLLGRGSREAALESCLKLSALIAAVHSLLIIGFRFFPDLKATFLLSGSLRLFKNPDRLSNYELGDISLNIFDPSKSGGLFDNANTAATFTLVAIGVLIATKNRFSRSSFLAMILVLSAGVLATGSKSGIFYLATLAILSYSVSAVTEKSKIRAICLLLIILPLFILLPLLSSTLSSTFFSSDLGQDTIKTGGYRLQLWTIAADAIKSHPVLGVGFGGWSEVMSSRATFFGVDPNWPPHNSLLQAWIETGVVGVVLLVCFWLALIWRAILATTKQTPGGGASLFSLVAAAGMSMGDPTPLLGAPQFAPMLGLLLALAFNRLDSGDTKVHLSTQ